MAANPAPIAMQVTPHSSQSRREPRRKSTAAMVTAIPPATNTAG